MLTEKYKSAPILGVGLGLRTEIAEAIFAHEDSIDFVECISEGFFKTGVKKRELLHDAMKKFPVLLHGVQLNIGSADTLDPYYLSLLKELLDEVNPPWFSDHLCFVGVDGKRTQELLPLPFTHSTARLVSDRIKQIEDFTQRLFLIENIAYYESLSGAEMSESQFVGTVLEQAGCGLLLDVSNLYVNSSNHNYSAEEYLFEIGYDRTVEIHVGGYQSFESLLLDTHAAAISQPVLELLRTVLRKVKVKAILLERDQNFENTGELMAELELIRQIVKETQPELLIRESTTSPPSLAVLAKTSGEYLPNVESAAVTQDLQTIQHEYLKKWSGEDHIYGILQTKTFLDAMQSTFSNCARLMHRDFAVLVRNYFDKFRPEDFQVKHIGAKFPEYLSSRFDVLARYPFIAELADLEWTALLIEESMEPVDFRNEPLLLDDLHFSHNYGPILNSTLRIRRYKHDLVSLTSSGDFSASSEEDVGDEYNIIGVYRNSKGDVSFMQIGSTLEKMLEHVLQQPTISFEEWLNFETDSTAEDLLEAVRTLAAAEVVIGYCETNSLEI